MWGFLVGLYIAMIIYPVLDEWQQRRTDKKLLAKLRMHHAKGHKFDATNGKWVDE